MKKRRRAFANVDPHQSRENRKETPAGSACVQGDAEESSSDHVAVPQGSDQRRSLCSVNYNKNLLKYLNDDRQRPTSFCDLLVVVEGKEFKVHKVVVAVGSSYFHACLSKNPQTEVVTLDHVSSSVFQHLLHFLYTSEFLVWENEISIVLEAAKFLDIIDAVKLLAAENDGGSQVGIQSNPKVDESDNKAETSNKCQVCGRNFCYKKTLENHIEKAHGFGKQCEALNSDPSTRKSTRKRKCPAKFANGKELENNSMSSSESDKSDQDRTLSSESDSEANEEENELRENEQAEEGDDGEETSGEDDWQSAEELDGPEEANVNSDAGGNYPEGLAPIVLQKNSKKLLKCPKCEKIFDRVGKYESHTRVHTGEKPFECDICQQRYSTKSNLTVHRKRHASETVIHSKEHKCPFCSKLHASRKTLVKHVRRFHPEKAQEFLAIKKIKNEGWKCDICNKSFTRRPHLEEHMILHTQDKPFKCTYCDEKFKSRFKRLKHQEKFHLGPFPCDICGRQFNDSGNLKRHIDYTHGGKRKWTCFICGKSVRERTTLKEHLRIHSGEKPHLCSICGQNFRHGSSYRLHLRVHHDDKRYECDECGKTFIRHDHLTKHKKIHSGEKAHQCEECGKCFGRRDHLTVHYKSVHLGEKVWQKYKATFHQCEVCKKVFKGKSSLEMHFRTHSGEKPYECHICNQSFRIKKTLTKHLVIHSDARPFNCQHCNATFKRKDKLKYHIDHVHNSKAEEETCEEPKSFPVGSENTGADICVPLTLVPVDLAETEGELERHNSSVLPAPDYPRTPDLAFLEKYTLTPQPTTLLHPVRPEQLLESREHSYLGTLLGLEPPHPVQSVVTGEHH
ncbi:zinc finger and BTB domain-containing protein 41 [Spea bombifrons]|uniref:zinc finger and BTB domain-containing protein 41 n=1 Tax=Spea bombifrons TaxID=233779 RepID=UPI00234994C3|nr:zinc finger and BTB domain-containing protein 41 [Spea bombifrons]